MTKAEIIAELRRSACEDFDPYGAADYYAWRETIKWSDAWVAELDDEALRMFYLLVAEAL